MFFSRSTRSSKELHLKEGDDGAAALRELGG